MQLPKNNYPRHIYFGILIVYTTCRLEGAAPTDYRELAPRRRMTPKLPIL